MNWNRLKLATGLFSAAVITAGCGGDGGSGAAPPPQPSMVSVTTSVIDGAIQGATVCLDKNGNGMCDADEPSGTTAADGSVTLSVLATDAGKFPLLALVGANAADTDSGPVTTAYVMQAPADNTGVISPLTTMVQQLVASSNVSSSDAAKIVADQTGITTSLFADYTKTRDSDPASATAGQLARVIVTTLQEQTQALSASVGTTDGSGGTISVQDVNTAVVAAVESLLAQVAAAAANSDVQTACAGSSIGSTACATAVTAAADAVLPQTNLSAATLPTVVGINKQLATATADPAGAPTPSATLDYARFGDADNWYYRAFVATAAESTPDADGFIRYREIRSQMQGGVLTQWAYNTDPGRQNDAHWDGTAWANCPLGWENTQTVRDAMGRNTTNYCDNYQLSNGQRVDVDISGKAMSDIVATIRSFPSTYNDYPLWGTAPAWFSGASGFGSGSGTFPPNSKLRYQTTTPTATAFAYDVRSSNVVNMYSAAVAAGGDARGNSASACNSAEYASGNGAAINVGTLENLVSRNQGTPCIFNPGSLKVGSTTYTDPNDPTYSWGNSTVSVGTIGSVSTSSTPTAYFTGNTLIRVAFTGTGANPVTYYACQQRFGNGGSRACEPIGTGTYTITTLGDARVLTMSNPPAQAGALTYNRVFVERGGNVYFGYQSKLIPSQSIRLNLEATNAVFTVAGVPPLVP